eukprot:5682337-Prymnesium_polylepis.1
MPTQSRYGIYTPLPSNLTIKLADGESMPAIGFGTFEIKDEDAERVVLLALHTGYRHIDTAEGCNACDAIRRAALHYNSIRRAFLHSRRWRPTLLWQMATNQQWAAPSIRWVETRSSSPRSSGPAIQPGASPPRIWTGRSRRARRRWRGSEASLSTSILLTALSAGRRPDWHSTVGSSSASGLASPSRSG